MSKTACWATNRLDVDIAEVGYGYGSCFDLSSFHLSLEGVKCLARFDYSYFTSILSDMKYVKGAVVPEDVQKKMWEYYHKTIDNKYSFELNQEVLAYLCEHFSLYHIMSASPMRLHFVGMDKEEAHKKCEEWMKEILLENGKYNHPKMHAEYRHKDGTCYDGGVLPLKFVPLVARSDQYPDAEMYNRIMYMASLSEGREGFGGWTQRDPSSTDKYLCTDHSESRRLATRDFWWCKDFAELKYPGPITASTDEEIIDMLTRAANYSWANFYSYKLNRNCEDVHYQCVEELWSVEKIKAWFDEHSPRGNTYMHVVDIFKRDSDQEIEIHFDNRNDGMNHNLGLKVIFDKRKTYTTWTEDRWWDWHKDQHKKYVETGEDQLPPLF